MDAFRIRPVMTKPRSAVTRTDAGDKADCPAIRASAKDLRRRLVMPPV
jgi:hypothetical protein